MKHLAFLLIFLFIFLLLLGCEDKITEVISPEELSPPLGLKSVTGDQKVTLIWYTSNFESDLDGYLIYRYDDSYSNLDPKEDIPSVFLSTDPETLEVSGGSHTQRTKTILGLTNGQTYSFLVVAAKDDWTEISHTSNIVRDTPRPETGPTEYATVYAYAVNSDSSGYELSDFSVSDMTGINIGDYSTTSGIGDIICERIALAAGTRLWIAGTNGAVTMDLGYMSDWNSADVAPQSGYANTGYSLTALLGHVYAIKTGNNHYGKIQIVDMNVSSGWISFKACYQPQAGNREYRTRP